MRPLHVILGLLTFTTFAAASGCTSNISGTGGSSSSSSSTSTGQSTGTGGSSSGSVCVATGQSCADPSLFCCTDDDECISGVCQPCMEGVSLSQCMCGDTPVGPASQGGCIPGEGCGLDAGLPDGGACQCVETSMQTPCP